MLYTIKYALFGHQAVFHIEQSLLSKILSLAAFLCLYYVKEWCTATSACEALINDLAFYKKLSDGAARVSQNAQKYPPMFLDFIQAAQQKLFKHSWYLSERLVVLCLCSPSLSSSEKVRLWKTLNRMKGSPSGGTIGNGLQQQALLTSCTKLEDLVGPDSWVTLKKLSWMKFMAK